jgi:hypothetical protein
MKTAGIYPYQPGPTSSPRTPAGMGRRPSGATSSASTGSAKRRRPGPGDHGGVGVRPLAGGAGSDPRTRGDRDRDQRGTRSATQGALERDAHSMMLSALCQLHLDIEPLRDRGKRSTIFRGK